MVRPGYFSVIVQLLLALVVVLFPCLTYAGPAGKNLNIPGLYGTIVNNLRPVQPGTLPVPLNGATNTPNGSGGWNGFNYSISPVTPNAQGGNNLTIFQTAPKVSIDWKTFDIGSSSLVYFNQQGNSSWISLNRIWDSNPSQIYGQLRADGHIYLINQNGILFGPGSTVNVNTLVASALNLRNIDFFGTMGSQTSACSSGMCFYNETGNRSGDYYYDLNGAVQALDYSSTGTYGGISYDPVAAIANYGNITAVSAANSNSSVFLIGPNVENWGTITSDYGQIGLIGTTGPMTLAQGYSCARDGNCTIRNGLVPSMPDNAGGNALNGYGGGYTGQLNAQEGLVGMYGRLVQQNSIITAVTAVRQNGQVELRATTGSNCPPNSQCGIVTGPNSQIISDISNSSDTAESGYPFNGGVINMGPMETIYSGTGQVVQLQPPQYISLSGSIYAPSGYVNINAGSRVYIDGNATIDVSGKWSSEPASNILLQAQLNSMEMQNAYSQKSSSALYGQTITFNPLTWPVSNLSGSLLAQYMNVTGEITSQLQTAQEKAINGGYIWITSGYDYLDLNNHVQSVPGDIIAMPGAVFNMSGGGIHYTGGRLDTTQLEVIGGKIYDISNAPADLTQSAIIGIYTKRLRGVSFNTSESWTGLYYGGGAPLNTFVTGFDKGGNAGSLNLDAATVVLEGQIVSTVTKGLYQTANTNPAQYPYNYQADPYDAVNVSYMQGVEIPSAGELIIDTTTETTTQTTGSVPTTISVVPDSQYVSSVAGFTSATPMTTPLPNQYNTVISSRILNGASLSNLTLNAKAGVTIEPGVNINLSPGGYVINQYSPSQWPNQNTTYDKNINHYWLNATGYINGVDLIPSFTTVYYAGPTGSSGIGSLAISALQVNENAINDNTPFPYTGTNYSLSPRGHFNAQAAMIEVYGTITVPSGAINLGNNAAVTGNIDTTDIFLSSGSSLDVSGLKIDNSMVGKGGGSLMQVAQFYRGGTITLDAEALETSGIFVQPSAGLDVSGGYVIGTKGTVTAGNAGFLNITSPTIMLDGDIKGYALPDSKGGVNGGTVTLQAFTIDIKPTGTQSPWNSWNTNFGPNNPVPANSAAPLGTAQNLLGTLVLPGDYFTNTGFTSITLNSSGPDISNPETVQGNAVILESGAQMSTSLVRLRQPVAGSSALAGVTSNWSGLLGSSLFSPVPGNANLVALNDPVTYEAGTSSFTATTGNHIFPFLNGSTTIQTGGDISIQSGASITTTPGGTIKLNAPGSGVGNITLAGTLNTPGGKINLSCGDNLVIGGQILAGGYTYINTSSVIKGYGYNWGTAGGGIVSLTGNSIYLNGGSVIDISGSGQVTDRVLSASGTLTNYTTASGAGTLALTFLSPTPPGWKGTVNASHTSNVQGGTLSLTSSYNTGSSLADSLQLSAEDITTYLNAGFDALSFSSQVGIQFSGGNIGSQNSPVVIPRQLTLNAPIISIPSKDNYGIYLQSPWIILSSNGAPISAPSSGEGTLNLTAASSVQGGGVGFIDLVGPVFLSGFKSVMMATTGDIRATDVNYNASQYGYYAAAAGDPALGTLTKSSNVIMPVGMLWTAGDLTLQADRIYPDMMMYEPVYSPTSGTTTYSFSPSGYIFEAGVFNGQASNPSQGSVKIQPSAYHAGTPVYSAGGQLIVAANGNIDVEGTLAAPLGQIILSTTQVVPQYNFTTGITTYATSPPATGSGQIYIGSGTLTTAGSAMVPFGTINTNGTWTVTTAEQLDSNYNITGPQVLVPNNLQALFPNSVSVNSDTVIISANGTINTSGNSGGGVFPLLWREDVTGSQDPLYSKATVQNAQKSGQGQIVPGGTNAYSITAPDGNTAYVILPGVQEPGPRIYLPGGRGLSPGYYSLLPIQYAFQPGAYVIELQPGKTLLGTTPVTTDDYPLVTGYYSQAAGTGYLGTAPQIYSVKPISVNSASDYLTVGHYNVGHYDGLDDSVILGNSGKIAISSNTAVINGSLIQLAQNGIDPTTGNNYIIGDLFFSGQNIVVRQLVGDLLGSSYQYGDPLPSSVQTGYLYVSAAGLSKSGNIYMGDSKTHTISVDSGSVITAPFISLTTGHVLTDANGNPIPDMIDVMGSISASEIDFTTSTTGTARIEASANLNAQTLGFNTGNLVVNPNTTITDLQFGNGTITVKSPAIFVGGTNQQRGLLVTNDLWNILSTAFKDITLQSNSSNSGSGIHFQDNFNLSAVDSLTLDAILIDNYAAGLINVTLSAPVVNLINSGSPSGFAHSIPYGNSSFTVIAEQTNSTTPAGINIGGVSSDPSGSNVLIANFGSVNLNTTGDLALLGKGSLTTGMAPLTINAARVVTKGVTTGSNNVVYNTAQTTGSTYIAPDFYVYTGSNYYNDFASASYNPNPGASITMNGAPIVNGSSITLGTSPAPGGTLEFWGTSIDVGTIIQSDGGTIGLNAASTASTSYIHLHNGGKILALGTDIAPGGQVALQTDIGGSGIILDNGSLVDVSAGTQGDAGSISLSSPGGLVSIGSGTLKGTASGGIGGSLAMDANSYVTLTTIPGDFTEAVDIRQRTGDLNIIGSITAYNVTLTADGNNNSGGNINLNGTIDADAYGSHMNGGSVEIYADNNLNVTGTILARASGMTDAIGGNVLLSSENGSVYVYPQALINVAGGPANKVSNTGGTVYLRAQHPNNNSLNITLNSYNSIVSASAVYEEAFERYDVSGLVDQNGNFSFAANSGIVASWFSDASNFMAAFGSAAPSNIILLPGIEVINTKGSITIDKSLDLTQLGYDKHPGVLTLRAADDLNINNNLVDHPSNSSGNSYNYIINSNSQRNSWGVNLVAGADLTSANYMAVHESVTGQQTGSLLINNNSEVYTENAPLRFASALDTIIDIGSSAPQYSYMVNNMMRYNIGDYAGKVSGFVGRNLILTGGAIQTAIGDIDVSVGGNLYLNVAADAETLYTYSSGSNGKAVSVYSPSTFPTLGSIRTTGQTTASNQDAGQYWTYAGGGNITLHVRGSVTTMDGPIDPNSPGSPLYATSQVVSPYPGMPNTWQCTDAWDTYYYPVQPGDYVFGIWGADYVRLSGTYANLPAYPNTTPPTVNEDVTEGLVTMGGGNLYIRSAGDFRAQAGTFGPGTLSIYAGGNVLGRFLSYGANPGNPAGQANISAMGNFGYYYYSVPYLNASTNPTGLVGQVLELFDSQMTVSAAGDIQLGAVVNPPCATNLQPNGGSGWDLQYTPNTAIRLTAGYNITYYGSPDFYEFNSVNQYSTVQAGTQLLVPGYADIMPATVSMNAANGDLQFVNNSSFCLAPSPTGGLTLYAYGSIDGYSAGSLGNQANITMSDIAPQYVYALNCPFSGGCGSLSNFSRTSVGEGGVLDLSQVNQNGSSAIGAAANLQQYLMTNYMMGTLGNGDNNYVDHLLYSGDKKPFAITAKIGDIESLNIQAPEQATISAGRDILDMWYYGQNLNPSDVSMISAGRNITLLYKGVTTYSSYSVTHGTLGSTGTNAGISGFLQAGPGTFIVHAGGYIDLGTEISGNQYTGIMTIGNAFAPGNQFYSGLPDQGSQLIVISGYNLINEASTLVGSLFNELKTYGSNYASDKSGGNMSQAAIDLGNAESAIASTLTASNTPTGVTGATTGEINMDYNTIQTVSGLSDMFVFSANNVNVGKTAIIPAGGSGASNTGITTTGGGAINIFALYDVNVNQSRIMTDFGGDINIWSDQANINAGRGSKTQIYVAPAAKGQKVKPGSEGSGIRCLTYNPNTSGFDEAPPEGNILLMAPHGIIDAGEAGISGGKVTIAATQVLNSQNITFSAGSVGVPQAASTSTTIGSLSGSNSTTQSSQSLIDASGSTTGGGRTAQAAQMLDDFIMKWLDVKVIDFVEDDM